MAKNSGHRTLKHPILNNVEYCSIMKNRRSVLEIDGKDLEGKTWREFQLYVGEKIGEGRCYFTIKFKDNPQIFSGAIRAVSLNQSKTEDPNMDDIRKEFNELKNALSKATNSGGITFEMLMQSTKQGYEAQINFLNLQSQAKDETIRELKKDKEVLEEELNECDDKVNELQAKTGWVGMLNTYKPLIEAGLMKLGAKGSPVTLSAPGSVNVDDIPGEVLQILARVDYVTLKQSPENYQKILDYLNQYISILPLKR